MDTIGPSYGEWWKERPAAARTRLAIGALPCFIGAWLLSSLGHREDVPALFTAIERGDSGAVRALVARGTPATARDGRGATLLHWAIETGRTDIITLMLDAGVDPDGVDRDGLAPLHRAAAARADVAAVRLLLERGASAGTLSPRYGAPLHWAASAGSETVIRLIVAAGADLEARDEWGRTPLHYAVVPGHRAAAQALIEHGASVDAAGPGGRTLMHWAAASGRTGVLDFLVRHGADVGARDAKGNTPLHAAARAGDADAVSQLLASGAGVDAASPLLGVTALHLAAGHGHVETVRVLLAAGADPDAPSRLYGTPLHWAAAGARRSAVEALLAGGANPGAIDDHGLSALARAASGEGDDVARLLGSAARSAPGDGPGEERLPAARTARRCTLPELMHPASRRLLDAWVEGALSTGEFRRKFSLPNSAYVDLGACLVELHE